MEKIARKRIQLVAVLGRLVGADRLELQERS
jgi:hypothetical protein